MIERQPQGKTKNTQNEATIKWTGQNMLNLPKRYMADAGANHAKRSHDYVDWAECIEFDKKHGSWVEIGELRSYEPDLPMREHAREFTR